VDVLASKQCEGYNSTKKKHTPSQTLQVQSKINDQHNDAELFISKLPEVLKRGNTIISLPLNSLSLSGNAVAQLFQTEGTVEILLLK